MMKYAFWLLLTCWMCFAAGCVSMPRYDVTFPADVPDLAHIHAQPDPVNPGAVVLLQIQFLDSPGNLNGGTVVVTDSQGNSYHQPITQADLSSSGGITSSLTLSPLVASGELLLQVVVFNEDGHSSNAGFVTLKVL